MEKNVDRKHNGKMFLEKHFAPLLFALDFVVFSLQKKYIIQRKEKSGRLNGELR